MREETLEKAKKLIAAVDGGLSVEAAVKKYGLSQSTYFRMRKLIKGDAATQIIVHNPDEPVTRKKYTRTVDSQCVVVVTKVSNLRQVLSELA